MRIQLLRLAYKTAIQRRAKVSLADIIAEHPAEQGLAELMAYFALTEDGIDLVIDDDARQRVEWVADDETRREADVPTLLYVRHDQSPAKDPS